MSLCVNCKKGYIPPGCGMCPHCGEWDLSETGGIGSVSESKALACDTQIPTPQGWALMSDLAVGDYVFNELGAPCQILWCSPITYNRPCYEVVFSDGLKIIADADHLWTTISYAERTALRQQSVAHREQRRIAMGYKERRTRACTINAEGSVRTTLQLAETLKVRRQNNHAVVRAAPIQLPDIELPIPPYTLGVWLGDGSSSEGCFTGVDEDIAIQVQKDGYKVRKKIYPNRTPRWVAYGLYNHLRVSKLLNNKHIPEIYFRASVAQRLELLRGMMDTDGCATETSCIFVTTRKSLRDGMCDLLASLGIKQNYIESRSKLGARDCGPCWRFSFSTALRVFILPRKAQRQIFPKRRFSDLRYITEVNRVPSVPVRCIAVDSKSKLYLAGRGLIPTHNTMMLDQVQAVTVERLHTSPAWDPAWGGGIVPSSLTLMGGSAGCLTGDTIVTLEGQGSISLGNLYLKFNKPHPLAIMFPTYLGLLRPTMYLRSIWPKGSVGPNPIVGVIKSGVKPVIKVEFKNGASLTLTDDHPVASVDGEYIPAGDLRPGALVLTQDARSTTRVQHIVSDGKRMTYDVQMESPANNFVANGIFVKNCGKTTLLLKMASIIAEITGKSSYFLSAEQAPGEIKLTTDRLQIPNTNCIRVMSEFGTGAEIDDALLKKDPPGMFVVDSISALCGKDKDAALVIAKKYKVLATRWKAPAFLISHMTKENDYAGLYAMQHEVDTLITVGRDFNERSVEKLRQSYLEGGYTEEQLEGLFSDMRVITSWKNRYGPTGQDIFLAMTPHGLVGLPPPPESKKSKLSSRRAIPPPPSEPPVTVEIPEDPLLPSLNRKRKKKPAPEAITVNGQKLVRVKGAVKDRVKEQQRARAIEGEALKKKRPAVKRTKEAKEEAVARRKKNKKEARA